MGEIGISVIICAYSLDRYRELNKSIQSILNQTHPPLELIVVIDNNEELFELIEANFPTSLVVRNINDKGLSGARNTGLDLAQGDVVAFIDDDAIAEPDWIERMVVRFNQSEVIGIGGRIIPVWQNGRPDWFPEEFDWVVGCSYKGMPESVTAINKVIGCNMAFRKNAVKLAGGFSSGLGRIGSYPLAGEETELCFSIRKRYPNMEILYDPNIVVRHSVPESRANWSYYKFRCFMGGISNFLVSKTIGFKLGMEAERSFIVKVLSVGFVRYFYDGVRHLEFSEIKKALLLFLGLLITTVGYLYGTFTPRHQR